jgi:hypothetical protein
METCPACHQASIPGWHRWLSNKTFECRSCKTRIQLMSPAARLSKRSANIALFVVFPLFIVAIPALPLMAALMFHAHREAIIITTLGIMVLASSLMSLRKTAASVFTVSEVQTKRSDSEEIRDAWKVPEFRMFVLKLVVVLFEIFGLFALVLPTLMRIAKG